MKNERPRAQIDRAVGVPIEHRTIENEKKLYDFLSEKVSLSGADPIPYLEVEKSEVELLIIEIVEESVYATMSVYGRKIDVPIDLRKVHVLNEGGTEEYTDRFVGGAFAPNYNSVLVDRDNSKVNFAMRLFHEFFHLKSYSAQQLIRQGTGKFKSEFYRDGFSVVSRDGEKVFFTDLNEAVTELMTIRFYEEVIKKHPIFQDEFQDGKEPFHRAREVEIEKFEELVDDLWIKNKDKYKNRLDIENIFIDAAVNGNLLPVGRIVERTYGKGSFRKIGEISIHDE
jgi:hypothetical protein